MSNYSNTKATIAANVYTNHNNEVTAEMVKAGINAVVDTLIAGGFIYKGVATTSTNPGSPDANVFYIATAPGTYTNFGSLVVNDGEVCILKYNGSWSKEVTGAATAAQVSALGQEVSEEISDLGVKVDGIVRKAYQWSDGYVNASGTIASSTASQFCQPILFHAGERLTYRAGTDYSKAVVEVADDTPLNVGSSGFVVQTLINAPANTTLTYTFQQDMYVVISAYKADQTLIAEDLSANSLQKQVDSVWSSIGVDFVEKALSWSSGYITSGGTIASSTASQFCQPVLLKAGETVFVRTTVGWATAIAKTTNVVLAVGSSVTPLKVTTATNIPQIYTYTADADTYITISVRASDYQVYFSSELNNNLSQKLGVASCVTINGNGGTPGTWISGDSFYVSSSGFTILFNGLLSYIHDSATTRIRAIDIINAALNTSYTDISSSTYTEFLVCVNSAALLSRTAISTASAFEYMCTGYWYNTNNYNYTIPPGYIPFISLQLLESKTAVRMRFVGAFSQFNGDETNKSISTIYAEKIALMRNAEKNGAFSCLFFSDIHKDTENLQRILSVAKENRALFDCIINGGDTVENYGTEGLSWYNDLVDESPIDVLTAMGNHDAISSGGLRSESDTYNLVTAPVVSNVSNIVVDTGANRYYKDYGSVRVIVLDAMSGFYWDAAAETWLAVVLSDAITNSKAVLCVSHAPFATTDAKYTFQDIDEFKDENATRGFFSYIGTTSPGSLDLTAHLETTAMAAIKTFIDGGGKFVGWLTGHTHYDFFFDSPSDVATYGYQPLFTTETSSHTRGIMDCDKTYGNMRDAINMVCVDTTLNVLKIVRLGINKDLLLRPKNVLVYDYDAHKILHEE